MKPREDYEFPIHGAACELISAMSCLNMEPDPLNNGELYLSQNDGMAKHSMDHMYAAFKQLKLAQRQMETLSRNLSLILDEDYNLDVFLCDLPTLLVQSDQVSQYIHNKYRQRPEYLI
jgi:hypothetical protein